jgi:YVTN family beta-propeller protein
MVSRGTILLVVWAGLSLAAFTAEPSTQGRQKLYVTNSDGNDVTIIDLATKKVLSSIEVGPHPHGIAVPAAQDVVYVTIEGKDPGELVAIDPVTDKIIWRMDVGREPNQLAVTPDGKFAYVPTNDNGNWDVVDLQKKQVIKRIPVGGRPHNTVCSPDGKHMYLAPMGSPKKVTIVEVATHEPVGVIAFSDVVRPIALSKDEKRFYAEVDGLVGMEVADVAGRKMIHRVPAELTEEQRKVGSRSHGLAIRPDQKEIWECDVEHEVVHVYDLSAEPPRQTTTIPMGGKVYWLTFSPDGKTAYVSVRSKDEVAIVDTESKTITGRIPAGKVPKRLLVVTLPAAGK